MKISLVVAVADNGVIGREGDLPWRISADLKHFKALTMGHPIIMGRKTWDSLGRPLPGRTNIVITRDQSFTAAGAIVVHDIEAAIAQAASSEGGDEAMVIGGAEIYRQVLPRTDRIYLTEVHEAVAGDTWFPELDQSDWQEVARDDFAADGDIPAFSFVTLQRKDN